MNLIFFKWDLLTSFSSFKSYLGLFPFELFHSCFSISFQNHHSSFSTLGRWACLFWRENESHKTHICSVSYSLLHFSLPTLSLRSIPHTDSLPWGTQCHFFTGPLSFLWLQSPLLPMTSTKQVFHFQTPNLWHHFCHRVAYPFPFPVSFPGHLSVSQSLLHPLPVGSPCPHLPILLSERTNC